MKGITVGFIGAGMMAEALIGGALKMELLPAGKIVASDVNPARRSHLAQKYGVRVTGNNRDVVAWADLVVLAVKPQHASGV
ncbi:MAG: NAD(P)-binding domain-containing protein, partial [Clostridia bacterium]